MDKSNFEQRINRVTGYSGNQQLSKLIALAIARTAPGAGPEWLVARACMSIDEYIDFGNSGRPWKFLRGDPDKAQRCIATFRKSVEGHCATMKLTCNWAVLDILMSDAA
jgi:hypothetical protein